MNVALVLLVRSAMHAPEQKAVTLPKPCILTVCLPAPIMLFLSYTLNQRRTVKASPQPSSPQQHFLDLQWNTFPPVFLAFMPGCLVSQGPEDVRPRAEFLLNGQSPRPFVQWNLLEK